MKNDDIKKLSRSELLEMLIEQSARVEELEKQVSALEEKLKGRELRIDQAGSIAEAALQLNGVFEAAEEACRQYKENIQLLSSRQEEVCARMESESKAEAERTVQEANARSEQMLSDAKTQSEQMLSDAKTQSEQMLTEAKTQSEQMLTEAKTQSEQMLTEAKTQSEQMLSDAKTQTEAMTEAARKESDGYWNDVSEKLEKFYAEHIGLREILSKLPNSTGSGQGA